MMTNEEFMRIPLESYTENICTPSAPNGTVLYIRIATPSIVHSYMGVVHTCGWHVTPHIIPLCMRYSTEYSHAVKELTFTLQDIQTGEVFTGKFAEYDPSPRRKSESPPPDLDSATMSSSCAMQMPRRFVCSLNVAKYVDLPPNSATYIVRANSRDIVSNACKVAVVWHTR